MGKIVLKTLNRKTTVTKKAVREAVREAFSGTLIVKSSQEPKKSVAKKH